MMIQARGRIYRSNGRSSSVGWISRQLLDVATLVFRQNDCVVQDQIVNSTYSNQLPGIIETRLLLKLPYYQTLRIAANR